MEQVQNIHQFLEIVHCILLRVNLNFVNMKRKDREGIVLEQTRYVEECLSG
jgi:hypothetical protein